MGSLPGKEKHRELGACLFSPKSYCATAGDGEPEAPYLWAEAPFILVRVSGLSPPEACLPVCYEYSVRVDAS